MEKKNKYPDTVMNLGEVLADITMHRDGSYTAIISENSGCRPEVGKFDIGNRNILMEVLSWFLKK